MLCAVSSLLSQRFLLGEAKLHDYLLQDLDIKQLATSKNSGLVIPERLLMVQALDSHEQRLLTLSAYVVGPMFLCLSLNSMLSIFGLVLSFISRQTWLVLPFVAGNILLNLVAFPRVEAVAVRGLKILRSVN